MREAQLQGVSSEASEDALLQSQQDPSCPCVPGKLGKWAQGQIGLKQAQLGPSKPLIIFLVNENLRSSSQSHWEDPGPDVTMEEEGTRGNRLQEQSKTSCLLVRGRKLGYRTSS